MGCVGVLSLVSFFAKGEPDAATGDKGGVTCGATGCTTLGLATVDSDGIVAGVLTTARSSGELRLDAGVSGAVGAAVFAAAGCADSCTTGGDEVEILNGPFAGSVAAGVVRTESGGTLAVGVAETVRSSPGLRLDGGVGGATCGATDCITLGLAIVDSGGIVAGVLTTARSSGELRLDAGVSGAVGAAVFSEAGCVDSGLAVAELGATGGGVETFSWPFAGSVAAGVVRTESGGTLGVGVAETVRSSAALRLDGGAGGVTCGATDCITLGLAIVDSGGIVAGVLTTARSSGELRLDAGVSGAVGAAVFSAAGCADSCLNDAGLGATGGDEVEILNGPFAGGIAAGLVRTESGGTLAVGVAETVRSSAALRLDGGADGAGASGAVGAAVELGATGGGVVTFSWPFAGGITVGLARAKSGGADLVAVTAAVETSAGLRLPGPAAIVAGVRTGL